MSLWQFVSFRSAFQVWFNMQRTCNRNKEYFLSTTFANYRPLSLTPALTPFPPRKYWQCTLTIAGKRRKTRKDNRYMLTVPCLLLFFAFFFVIGTISNTFMFRLWQFVLPIFFATKHHQHHYKYIDISWCSWGPLQFPSRAFLSLRVWFFFCRLPCTAIVMMENGFEFLSSMLLLFSIFSITHRSEFKEVLYGCVRVSAPSIHIIFIAIIIVIINMSFMSWS